MQRLTKSYGTCCLSALAGVLLSWVSPTNAADFSLRVNTGEPPGSISGAGMESLKKCVEGRSGGRIEAKLFYSGALGNDRDGLEGAQTGSLDIHVAGSAISNVDRIFELFALPYIFRDREHVDMVMDGPVRDVLYDRLSKKGLVMLGLWELGFRQITNNVRPISTPADLKGMKIRTPPSQIRIKIFNSYGAVASALPYSELYSALQLGVFDGQENPAESVKSAKMYEVQKYLSITNHVYSNFVPLMNKAKLEKMPFSLQLLTKQCGFEARKATVDHGIKEDKDVIAFLESKGMKTNNADTNAFVAASRPIWKDLAQELGPDGSALIDLIAEVGKK